MRKKVDEKWVEMKIEDDVKVCGLRVRDESNKVAKYGDRTAKLW